MQKLAIERLKNIASYENYQCRHQVYTLVYGVTTWPDEIDLSPDTMYQEIQEHGKWILK